MWKEERKGERKGRRRKEIRRAVWKERERGEKKGGDKQEVGTGVSSQEYPCIYFLHTPIPRMTNIEAETS